MTRRKKSEMLEVRLSHEDKQALQAKAADEGVTVSFVVRRLISEYLVQPATRSKPDPLMELFMTLKSRPKSLFATLASLPLLAAPFLLPSAANAGDISLTLKSEYTEPVFENDSLGKRVRRVNTEIEIDEGQFFSLPIATGLHHNPAAAIQMSFRVSEGANQMVKIEIFLCETTSEPISHTTNLKLESVNSCDGKKLIAQPSISTKYGETAEFRFEMEQPTEGAENDGAAEYHFGDDSRKMFKLMASPKKL